MDGDGRRSHDDGSLTCVYYRCGACGYQLNLNSANRNTSFIGSSKYEKLIKKGILSFFSIDESRFTQIEEFRWIHYLFTSKHSWGLFKCRTKLLCRNCQNHIGSAYTKQSSSSNVKSLGKLQPAISWDGISDHQRVYDIKISALQPSSSEDLCVFTLCTSHN